jgi:hypothetical protein
MPASLNHRLGNRKPLTTGLITITHHHSPVLTNQPAAYQIYAT